MRFRGGARLVTIRRTAVPGDAGDYRHDVTRIVLLHGAATTSAIWSAVAGRLRDHDVVAPDRPRTGDLVRELAWLTPIVRDTWVVGFSGGATLGLALAASDVRLAGAVLHEPAVGSLLPGLLAPMRAAFDSGGTAEFGRALYGEEWDVSMAGPQDDEVTGRELAMFAAFEAAPVPEDQGRIIVTVGGESPAIRHRSVDALRRAHGHEVQRIDGLAHFVTGSAAGSFAAHVRAVVEAE